jgi:kynurenine--oxoglutarate transaminase/cysteine-S-conjugate beta-lyase/glutamine--phenylpyruvate transaminase
MFQSTRLKLPINLLNGFSKDNNITRIQKSLKNLLSSNNKQNMSSSQAIPSNDVKKHYELNSNFVKVGDKNVWVEYTGLARDYNAVNLGQGFPDYQSVPYINEKVTETLKDSNCLIHQYTRSPGHLRLVNAIAAFYGIKLNREVNALSEVLITNGAYGSLFNVITSLVETDDEVIIIEPFYDCYAPLSIIAGAKCVFVPLKPKSGQVNSAAAADGRPTSSGDWIWDEAELEAAFTSKTKMIIINNPNNPLGKIFTKEELQKVADLCIKNNVICLSDEVYDNIVYDRQHIRIAGLPNMWERTITVGSAGKTFSSTGAKIGWTVGPKELVRLCTIVHNNSIYVCPTFMQDVIGRCFELENSRLDSPECYFNSIAIELKPKRDQLAKLLIDAGLTPIIPEGGYFMMADISKVSKDFVTDDKEIKDAKFVKHLIKEKGLATIPTSAFYSDAHKHLAENYIRFCFFKDDTTLEKAAEILKKMHL